LLEFREEYLRPVKGNPRGKATIEALGLNREKLVERRRDVLHPIRDLLECRELLAILVSKDPSPDNARRLELIDERLAHYIRKYDRNSAEYAAMVRAAFRARNRS
jgi:hypothetical protein